MKTYDSLPTHACPCACPCMYEVPESRCDLSFALTLFALLNRKTSKRVFQQVQVGGFDLIFNGNHVKPAKPTSLTSFLGAHNDRVQVRTRSQREYIKQRNQQQSVQK
jgi:hypothetical protein